MLICMKYQPTFSAYGREFTYQNAFSGEIARIVSLQILLCILGKGTHGQHMTRHGG